MLQTYSVILVTLFISLYCFLLINNNHVLRFIFVMVNFLLCDTGCVRLFGSVAWMYTMWAVHCSSALVSLTHLCVSFMLDAWMTIGTLRRDLSSCCLYIMCSTMHILP